VRAADGSGTFGADVGGVQANDGSRINRSVDEQYVVKDDKPNDR